MAAEDEGGVPIAAVEQATGIARATLRIWERRYGFPHPGRDPRGERSYPGEQVSKLRLIADLIAHGHRPGGLVQLTPAELSSLSGPRERRRGSGYRTVADDPVLALLRARDAAALLQTLQDALHALGAAAFVCERIPRMNLHVGLAWARGELEVYAEHLYTQAVEQVVRAEILARHAVPAAATPRVLLATFPDEAHGLGLLMVQALLALEGCRCLSLGVRVPLAEIVAAAAALHPDIVGLSFTASMNPAHVLRGLQRLRGELPREQAMWAGGSSPVLARVRIDGVQPVAHIRDVVPAVAHWRATHAPAA